MNSDIKHKVSSPGLLWSMEGRPCRMRVLAGVEVCVMGMVVTQTGLGWMGVLVLRMEVFSVTGAGRTSGDGNDTLESL